MNTEKSLKKKRKIQIVLRIAAVLLVFAVFGFFVLLIKTKCDVSCIYNYFVKTRGSLPVERFSESSDTEIKTPQALKQTEPSEYIRATAIEVNGEIVGTYTGTEEIHFADSTPAGLTGISGILTYRGNYTRNLLSYGELAGTADSLKKSWEFRTGRFLKDDGVNYWSGNGWTGQPLAVSWPDEWKQYMNLFPKARDKADLVEVIYPGMDGKIHFLDLDTGEETRDAINVGMIFKGTCSLHPDYPLLVCGSGDSAIGLFGEQVCARIFIYSLIDGTKLYEFAAADGMATRSWHGFDSSPVIDPATDTLIYPGENGVLYKVHLNTAFDEQSGRLTIEPDEMVKYSFMSYAADERYEASEYCNGSGSESSAAVWDHYLFFGDNGGIFQCLDLNTMEPVWVQDILEDINSSPVLETEDDGRMYIYVGTTLKYGYDSHHFGEACVYKLNAMTGEIVWKKPYEVHTMTGYAGGILSSGASGRGTVADYIYYAVSKTPSIDSGYVVALSKSTGEEYWRIDLDCDAWSSGCLVYGADMSARLVQCCGNGDILLIDAVSGEILDSINYGANIESTPVIYGNRLAVGLRSEYIIGAEILADGFNTIEGDSPQSISSVSSGRGEALCDASRVGGVALAMPDNAVKMFLNSYFDTEVGAYISYKTLDDALYALDSGKISALWATDATADYLESTGGYRSFSAYDYPGKGAERFEFAFAFSPENEELRRQANLFLGGEETDGAFSMRRSRKLYIGVTGAVPPLECIDEDGNVSGYACELAGRFAESLGMTPEFVVLSNENAFVELMAGRVDMLACYGTNENHSLNIPQYIMSDGYMPVYEYRLVTK